MSNSTNHSDHALTEQTLALAGIVQSALLVDRLSKTGYCDSAVLETQVHALLSTDPISTEAVFIDKHHLRTGLNTLKKMLNQEADDLGEVLRYSLSMMHLQKKMSSRKDMLNAIGSRIEQAKNQAEHFSHTSTCDNNYESLSHENVIANLAALYGDTISTFRFRIQVNGNPTYLKQAPTVNKIRCLLLSGIRCALLWQQCGGNRLHIIFKRKAYSQACDELLRLT